MSLFEETEVTEENMTIMDVIQFVKSNHIDVEITLDTAVDSIDFLRISNLEIDTADETNETIVKIIKCVKFLENCHVCL